MPLSLSLRRSALLEKVIQVIESFDPKKTTVDAYVEDATVLKDRSIGEVEQKFIHQCFYGCVRYQKFLKLFVTSFLYKCPTLAIRSEQTLYMILAYMLFFRLEELGVVEFRQMLNCGLGTSTALLALLKYALNVEELEKWVKMEWCKVYDIRYIEEDVIGRLQAMAEELRPVVEEVELKATGSLSAGDGTIMAPVKEQRKTTTAKPFNLTKPKPRLIPEPEVISREVKALPVPHGVLATSLADVEEEKRQRMLETKAQTAAKYDPTQHFQLQTALRRDGTEIEELTRKVDAERMAECTFQPAKARTYVHPVEDAVVRQNTSAVLREDALLKKKQAKECEILKRYEEDLHDASEFYVWQQNMKEKDQLEEQQRVSQRLVESQLAREEAMEAYEAVVRRKHILADAHREDVKTQLAIQEHENHLELQIKQKLVADTIDCRGDARIAEQEVTKIKVQNAEQVRKDKEADKERKAAEEAVEMERRKDLIRQIRALEKVPKERFTLFDPAEAPCNGFLEEMSLAELRERLKIVTAQHAQEVEDKRERQLEKKVEKQQELSQKAEMLAKIRDTAKDQAIQRKEALVKRAKEEQERQVAYREQCVQEAAEKIAKKKKLKLEEEMRLKKELKEISTKRQFLNANAEMVEAKAHREQHLGLEREARQRQKELLVRQGKINAIKSKEVNIRRENIQRDVAEYKVMQAAVDERLKISQAADQALKEDIKKANVTARTHQKTIERRLTTELGHSSNKYMQRVSSARLSATGASIAGTASQAATTF